MLAQAWPACRARALHEKGVDFQILEASDGIGGRVRTDQVDGFLLDRGFQVLLTAYPEAQAPARLPALDLKTLCPRRTLLVRRTHEQTRRSLAHIPVSGGSSAVRFWFSLR